MPITDVIKRRTYQNERKARIKQEAQIDAALVGNPQIAQAEEMRRIAQEYSERADRVEQEERARASNVIGNAQNGLDKYGHPIGTHDEHGRPYGQLDKARDDLAALNKQLSKLEGDRATLTTELDKAKAAYENSETTEQKIEAKTRLAAIKELLKDNNNELVTIKDQITSMQSDVDRQQAQYEAEKKNGDDFRPGGRTYENKMAYAEALLPEAQQQKRTAETNLNSGHYGDFDLHHWNSKLNCANANIDTYSTVKEWCAAQAAKSDELLKLWTLKEV